jgi:adenylate cyclase
VASATTLIVEDDADLSEMLEEHLGKLGYRVLAVSSAEAALAAVETETPDLVLSDVRMAGMTGIELCRRLKADTRFRFTPVVLLTAVSDLPSRVAGLAAGADDFFAKPCDLLELQTRIQSLLRIKVLHDEVEAQRRLLRTLFARHVSESVAEEIVRDPTRHLARRGEKREVTVFFGDLRGFTRLSAGLDAADVVDVVNAYLTPVIDTVFEFDGTLDKFHGDGVMAVFGAPIAHPDDPARAVRCGLAMQQRLRDLHLPKFPDLRFSMGIGINTGPVVAGTIGSERRMDYTVIGSEVNLAQRLEAAAGPGQILVTHNTYAHVRDLVEVREIGALRVKGWDDGVMAYDVLGLRRP